VHRGGIATSAVVVEGVEKADVDHGVERVGVAVEFGGVLLFDVAAVELVDLCHDASS
jgi:hypothetical protein